MIHHLRRCAPRLLILAVLALTACGSHSGKAASVASSAAAAHPTASADAAAAKAKAERIVNGCAVTMGGTKGPGVTALLSLPVLRKLATHSGRVTFGTCVFPDPAKRAAGITCMEHAVTLPGLMTHRKRAATAQAVFMCAEKSL